MASKVIKVGSKVRYRGGWGSEAPKVATVESIEETEESGYTDSWDKESWEVDSISFSRRNYACFCLDDGHWCDGDQIDEVLD